MYPQVFSAAKDVDMAFMVILGFSVFILIAVTLAMIWFLYRYNYKRHPKPSKSKGNLWAEIVWTGLPTLIVLGLFWTGWTSFKAMRTIPEGAMEVAVEARMWSWKFTYENGRTSKDLVVPVNTPVKLNLSARDVIHSFYVPALRVKWDMVPGLETDAWIQSDTVGDYDIFCAEYCGLKHADMLAVLKVVEQEEFDQWLVEDQTPKSGKPRGLALMEEYGCFDCHAMDGSDDVAPHLNGIGGTDRPVVLPDGSKRTVKADFAYLRQSITAPGAELVEGWDDEMPSYEGDMSEADIDIVANYMLGRDEMGQPLTKAPHPGFPLAESEGCIDCHSIDGSDNVGPTFKGLYGSTVAYDRNGEKVELKVDADLLRRAIVDPSEMITDGYGDDMPPYDDLDEQTLEGLIAYIKSLGGAD